MRVYEIIAAGSVEGYFAKICSKMAQHRRIVRFCNAKGLDCARISIVSNNYQQDLEKACILYRMGYADAIIIADMEGWSETEKDYFREMTNNKIKVINLNKLEWQDLLR